MINQVYVKQPSEITPITSKVSLNSDENEVLYLPHFLDLHSNLLLRVRANMSVCLSPVNSVETYYIVILFVLTTNTDSQS